MAYFLNNFSGQLELCAIFSPEEDRFVETSCCLNIVSQLGEDLKFVSIRLCDFICSS